MYHSAVPTSYFSIRYIPLHHQALHHRCTWMVQTPDHLRIITTINFFSLFHACCRGESSTDLVKLVVWEKEESREHGLVSALGYHSGIHGGVLEAVSTLVPNMG